MVRVVWKNRARQRRVFDMDGIEPSVPGVVGIELEAHEAAGEAGVERELVEQAGVAVASVEIEGRRECPGAFVEDVQWAGQIVGEKPRRSTWLPVQRVD